MKTKSKDQKIFNKFNKQFKFIFNDPKLSNLIQNHFNKNGSFVSFLIGLIDNQLSIKTTKDNMKINSEEWVDLFSNIYVDSSIKSVYDSLEINPAISYDEIVIQLDCFDNFINKFVAYLKQQNINLNIEESKLKKLIKNCFGYILYNSVEYKTHYNFNEILQDEEYDSKLVFIQNNTKLFANAKASIIDCCKDKINDLIVLLLGQSKSLSYEK